MVNKKVFNIVKTEKKSKYLKNSQKYNKTEKPSFFKLFF